MASYCKWCQARIQSASVWAAPHDPSGQQELPRSCGGGGLAFGHWSEAMSCPSERQCTRSRCVSCCSASSGSADLGAVTWLWTPVHPRHTMLHPELPPVTDHQLHRKPGRQSPRSPHKVDTWRVPPPSATASPQWPTAEAQLLHTERLKGSGGHIAPSVPPPLWSCPTH